MTKIMNVFVVFQLRGKMLTDANQTENKQKPDHIGAIARSKSRHFGSARRIEPEFPWRQSNTRLRSNQEGASLTLSDNISRRVKKKRRTEKYTVIKWALIVLFTWYIFARTLPSGRIILCEDVEEEDGRSQSAGLHAEGRHEELSGEWLCWSSRWFELHGVGFDLVCVRGRTGSDKKKRCIHGL